MHLPQLLSLNCLGRKAKTIFMMNQYMRHAIE